MGREWAVMFIPFGASTALVLATDKIANNALHWSHLNCGSVLRLTLHWFIKHRFNYQVHNSHGIYGLCVKNFS